MTVATSAPMKLIALKDCCEIVSGSTPRRDTPDFWGGDIDWVAPKELSGLDEPVLNSSREKITEAGLQSCSAKILPKGTVLFSSRAPIGHMAILGKPMCTNQGFKSFVPRNNIDSMYLYRVLRHITPRIVDLGRGATFKEVSKTIIGQVEIPIPFPDDAKRSLTEQRRIAGILDQADAIRRQRRAALYELNTLIPALFHDMFGDPIAKGWTIESVEDAADKHKGSIRTGPFGSQLLTSEFADHGVAVLGIDNAVKNRFRWGQRRYISESKYKQLKRYRVFPGDVIITIMGTCGRCAVIPEDIPLAINTKHLCCITPNYGKYMSAYLQMFFLQHPMARQYLARTSKGAIMDGLNMGIIKGMPIALAPMPLQQQFDNFVKQNAQSRIKLQGAIKQSDNLFNSLVQRAFRGEL